MNQVNLSNVKSLVECVQLVNGEGRELRDCIPRVTAVRKVRSSSCPPIMTVARARGGTQNTPLEITEAGLEENTLERCNATMNQGRADESSSSVRGMKRGRSDADEAAGTVEEINSTKKFCCSSSIITTCDCSETRMSDMIFLEYLIQCGRECEVWRQSTEDSFNVNAWDMCAQLRDQYCIPSSATPAQYLDICHSFGWGPFAVGGHLSMFSQYTDDVDISPLHPVDLDPPVVNVPVPDLGNEANDQVFADDKSDDDDNSGDSGNPSDEEVYSLDSTDKEARTSNIDSDDGFDPDETIIYCPDDNMKIVNGDTCTNDNDMAVKVDETNKFLVDVEDGVTINLNDDFINETSTTADDDDNDVLFLGEFTPLIAQCNLLENLHARELE